MKCSKCDILLTNENWWISWQKQKTNICIPCGKNLNKSWDTKDKQKNRALKNAFNISLDEYKEILKNQDNKCIICDSKQPYGKGSFHVDHCHNSGKIRGLLCHYCNVGLGNFKDDINLLKKAVSYMERNNAKL